MNNGRRGPSLRRRAREKGYLMRFPRPMAVMYFLLYLWAIGSASLALAVAMPEFLPVAQAWLWAGGAVGFLILGVFRPVLIGYFFHLSPRENSLLMLFHIGAFVTPLVVMSQPPMILCLVLLNVPLALMSHRPNQWRRLLLNSHLIVLVVLFAYPHQLALWERVALVAVVGLLSLWTVVTDHFASTLERARESGRDMGRTLAGVLARMTALMALAAVPLVTVTIALSPTPPTMAWDARGDGGERAERQLTRRMETPPPDTARLIRDVAILVLLAVAGFYLLRYLRQRLMREGGQAVTMTVDREASGQGVASAVRTERRTPPPLEGEREEVVRGFEGLCRAMEMFRLSRRPGLTAREYLATLSVARPGRGDVRTITQVFERARYGIGAIGAADLKDYRRSIEAIRLAGARAFAQTRREGAEQGSQDEPPRPAEGGDGTR